MVYRDDWNEVEIGELGEIITGQTPKTSISENYGGNLMFLTPSDDMDKRYVTDTNRKLTQLGAKSVKNKIIPPNSICVSCIGSQLGKVVITTEQTVTNQQINTIIPNDKTDYMYLYYAMKIVGKRLNHLSKTSTAVPIINKTVFSSEKILLPPLKEQIAIAKLLSSLDDKIENNKAIIANLEAQAQAIFKSWFVDFEPFQDGNFVESELGLIPEGWEVVELQKVANRKNGYTYKSAELRDESNINMLTLKSFNRNGGINFNSEKPIIQTDKMKEFHYLSNKDILIACTDLTRNADVIGRVISYIKNNEYEDEIYSMDLVKIEPKHEFYRLYLYRYLSSSIFKEFAESVSTGTTVLHLPKKSIDEFKLLFPSKNVIEKFSKLIEPIIEIEVNYIYQNQTLAEIRDTLLPKLMSGEIDLSADELEEVPNEI